MIELSRPVRVRELSQAPRRERVTANPTERAALARRFDMTALDRLDADLEVRREPGGFVVSGRVLAEGSQPCAVSGEPVAARIDEPVALRFSPSAAPEGDEVELESADLDVLPLDGETIDLGEIAAQSLGLALDPFPRLADTALADIRRRLLSEEEAAAQVEAERTGTSPFRVIKGGA